MKFFIIKWKLCYPVPPPHYFYFFIQIIVKHCCLDKNAIDLINNAISPFMALKNKHWNFELTSDLNREPEQRIYGGSYVIPHRASI